MYRDNPGIQSPKNSKPEKRATESYSQIEIQVAALTHPLPRTVLTSHSELRNMPRPLRSNELFGHVLGRSEKFSLTLWISPVSWSHQYTEF